MCNNITNFIEIRIVFREQQLILEDENNPSVAPLSRPPYNPYILVKNTGHDIHLIGAEPIENSINPNDTFRDTDGFPWALLIPVDWEHPDEGQRIEEVYPRFTSWRTSLGADDQDWYVLPSEPEDKFYIAGSRAGDAVYWQKDEAGLRRKDLYQSDTAEATDIVVASD